MKQLVGPAKAAWKLVQTSLVAGHASLRPAEAGTKKVGVKTKAARAADRSARKGRCSAFTVMAMTNVRASISRPAHSIEGASRTTSPCWSRCSLWR